MAFKFPLATVLRVRLMREEREERLLQQILFQIQQVMTKIAGIDAELERVNGHRTGHVFKPMSAHHLQGTYGELAYLRQSRVESESNLAKLEDLKDKQLAIYEAARRDRKMLTEMHDKQKNTFLFEAAKQEQRSVDEYFSSLRSRKAM
ncbi:flagellar FliJ protein [Bryocella elongata]|uniref:Flagellar FliJ protein n=1 Tax=Bryocella elongata TaxID=863522 RepID=A0A1H5TKB4_9BACT|nr:flagellar export protein FliJ [Bryocella elongata]SEF62628.1 flagellar FliJ protein [Bryocella elongata]